MINVLFPISLDIWTESISSKFRAIVTHAQAPDIRFFASSKPDEGGAMLPESGLWQRPNLVRIGAASILGRRFDVVHNGRATATNLAVATAVGLRSRGQARHIFSVSIEPSPTRWNFRHAQRLTQRADMVIANSQAVANAVEHYYGRAPDHIIPNGVDTEFFAPHAAAMTTVATYGIESPYVLFVGTLEPRKRPDLFVALAARLPQITFVMVGKNSHTSPLALDNLPANVMVLGLIPKPHVRDLLAGTLALLFPSELEGLPNAVLEALSMGVPVLAQPKSSLPEIIQDGQNGWLIQAEQPDLWVDLVRDLATWPTDRRDALRHAIRAGAVATYSWAHYTERHLAIYRQM
jgi:glycosyltransferase involved in cell wall biosynthesis